MNEIFFIWKNYVSSQSCSPTRLRYTYHHLLSNSHMSKRKELQNQLQLLQMERDELCEQHQIVMSMARKIADEIEQVQFSLDEIAFELEKTGTTKIFSPQKSS